MQKTRSSRTDLTPARSSALPARREVTREAGAPAQRPAGKGLDVACARRQALGAAAMVGGERGGRDAWDTYVDDRMKHFCSR